MTTPAVGTVTPLADTARPPLILTPDLNSAPNEATLTLLGEMVKYHLDSEEVYTITNCDYVSPEGPNFLFTIKQYYWEVEPGRWEARDGYQNRKIWPSKQQKQLETMSEAVYILSLGYKHLPQLRLQCMERIQRLLQVFFIDSETMMRPEAKYIQCIPSRIPMEGDHAFAISMRFLLLVSRALCYLGLPDHLDAGMRSWFEAHITFMRDSSLGKKAREWGDNKTIWYHAVLASHLRYVNLGDSRSYALESLETTIKAHPTPSELFKREMSRTRPAHYALFTLEPLFLLAALTTSDNTAPPGWIITWLQGLVDYARGIPIGEIESVREKGERVNVKLRWFEKMLDRWGGKEYDQELDGSLWELGWKDFAILLWGLV